MIKIFAPVLLTTSVQSVSCFLSFPKVRQAFAQFHGIYIHQNIKEKGCGKFQAGDELPVEYLLVLKYFPQHWLSKPAPGSAKNHLAYCRKWCSALLFCGSY